jgi:hypothetical protein
MTETFDEMERKVRRPRTMTNTLSERLRRTEPKKSVLTKGIVDMLSEGENAFQRAMKALSECSYEELVALRKATPSEIFKLMTGEGMDADTVSEAIAIVKGDQFASVIASVFSPKAGTENMTNLRSPGAPEGKIAVEPGKSGQNVGRHVPSYTVSGGKDEKVPNYPNPSSPGDGYPVEIGREDYTESRSTAGTSEDRQSTRTRTSSTRYDGLGQRGGQQPDHPPQGPGTSGNYGRQTSLVTRTDEIAPRENSYTAVKSLRQRDLEKASFARKVGGPSNAEIQELVQAEERRDGYRESEEIPLSIMRKAREVAARNALTDSRWVETVKELDAQILQKKIAAKMFRK